MADENLLMLTAEIVTAHVENNAVSISDLPAMIGAVYSALVGLGGEVIEPEAKQEPAVSIRASIKPDAITCLECGTKLKMIKRHLNTHHSMTPAQYKFKWKLTEDYPLVAPSYAAQRKALALKIGLGRKPGMRKATK